jgi:hypothetical protein
LTLSDHILTERATFICATLLKNAFDPSPRRG